MILKILIIISIILQLIAASEAIGLMRKTKYNLAWILFSIALTAMALHRLGECMQLMGDKELRLPEDFFIWMGVFTSLCFAVGVILVKKFITVVRKLDIQRRLTQKRIMNTIINTEEKERSRFSKDIHDGLGPLLSSAKLSLSALDRNLTAEQQKEIIKNTSYVIDEAINSLKEISNNLSPHILKDFGLERAITQFINKSSSKDKIKTNFTTNIDSRRFDINVEIIIYRVICELINNSIKHSEGDQIFISLQHYNDNISIDYSDNGKGFNTDAMMDVGMGLSNIKSRVNSIKGKVTISSEPNRGMHAAININLTKQELWKKRAK